MFFAKFFFISCVIFLQYVYINKVNSVCCEHKFLFECESDGSVSSVGHDRCGDCTHENSHCGVGECNILGCECKGGCRTGKCMEKCDRAKREIEDGSSNGNADTMNDDITDFIIEASDYDGDGYLNLTEAKFYVYRKQHGLPEHEVEAGIKLLDKNNDGYLSIDEIDG